MRRIYVILLLLLALWDIILQVQIIELKNVCMKEILDAQIVSIENIPIELEEIKYEQ